MVVSSSTSSATSFAIWAVCSAWVWAKAGEAATMHAANEAPARKAALPATALRFQ
jgi:hypothetical protein